MNTTKDSINAILEKNGMSNPIEISPEANFEGLPLETLNHNFIRSSNFYIRRGVPESHRRIADNFMIIKKIFGHPVVQSKITEQEKVLLAKYDFNPLEYSTAKQIEDEIIFLKKWSYSKSTELQEAADNIIKIRAKELKYLIATNFVSITNRVYNGYKLFEKYFEDISKYF